MSTRRHRLHQWRVARVPRHTADASWIVPGRSSWSSNFHGATIQRGWQRTYPNLMTTKSVRGAEVYRYDGGYAADAARRNTIFVFTRNAVASMDFTPVTFTDVTYPHLTIFGHELALSIVFEARAHFSPPFQHVGRHGLCRGCAWRVRGARARQRGALLGEGDFSASVIAHGA